MFYLDNYAKKIYIGNDVLTTYLCRHSPGAGRDGLTNRIDHVADGGTPGGRAVACCVLHNVAIFIGDVS